MLSLWCTGCRTAPRHWLHPKGPDGATSPTEGRVFSLEEPCQRAAILPRTHTYISKLLFPTTSSYICSLNSKTHITPLKPTAGCIREALETQPPSTGTLDGAPQGVHRNGHHCKQTSAEHPLLSADCLETRWPPQVKASMFNYFNPLPYHWFPRTEYISSAVP